MAPPKRRRRRAIRARAKQRPRHDVRSEYRKGDLPAEGQISVATVENPYGEASWIDAEGNPDISARLEQVRHADGTAAEGAPAWSPPPRPVMTVIRALRSDPIGRMFARQQIDQPQYLAGRAYQQTADQATLGAVRSVDLGKTKVSGGIAPDMLTPGKQRAMWVLRKADERVMHRHGVEGLSLCRAVLTEAQSVEAAARIRGAESDRDLKAWCWLFRACLSVLAVTFGYANSTRRPLRLLNGRDAEQDPADDPARQADERELVDPELRSARANGRG